MWKKLVKHFKKIAPVLAGVAGTAIGGPGAGGVLATIARSLTGDGEDVSLDAVATKLFGDPEMLFKMEQLAVQREKNEQDAELRKLELETKQQELVNLTMRAEFQAEDPWSRRWRPFIGFVFGSSLGVQSLGVTWVLVSGGDPELITALQALAFIWGPALAVLGVGSWTRGKEKVARLENGK